MRLFLDLHCSGPCHLSEFQIYPFFLWHCMKSWWHCGWRTKIINQSWIDCLDCYVKKTGSHVNCLWKVKISLLYRDNYGKLCKKKNKNKNRDKDLYLPCDHPRRTISKIVAKCTYRLRFFVVFLIYFLCIMWRLINKSLALFHVFFFFLKTWLKTLRLSSTN